MNYNYKILFFVLIILFLIIIIRKYKYIDFKNLENIKYTPKKIKVIMLCTPNYEKKCRKNINIYKKYCSYYGYDFKIYKKNLNKDLHINFSKMEMVKKELLINDNNEYLLMTDADITIKKYIPLEKIIKYIGDVKNIASPKDVIRGIIFGNHSLKIYQNSKINAGFILIKKNKRSFEIFDNWIKDAYGPCKHLRNVHPRNQNVFDNCTYKRLLINELKYIPWQVGGLPQSIYFSHQFAHI